MPATMYTNYQPYLDNISNTTDNQLIALLQQTSIATNYLPGTLLMLAIFIIIFAALKIRGTPTASAFLAASFAHMVLVILIYPLHILSGVHFYIALILPPISLFLMYLFNRQ